MESREASPQHTDNFSSELSKLKARKVLVKVQKKKKEKRAESPV